MKIDLTKYDEKHAAYIESLTGKMNSIYQSVIRMAVKYGLSVNFDAESGEIFDFGKFPRIKKKIEELFNEMHKQITSTVQNAISEEWQFSADKYDFFLSAMMDKTGMTKEEIEAFIARNNEGIKARRSEALEAFRNRVENGMNLSDRVWNLTDQFKSELELAIDVGISEGKSADEISRDIRQYLNNPDKLFRRVRDKHGNLKLSKAAAAYHPGQGVYRSSYKNAMRVARTEVNMAYRSADHENWNAEKMVIGIKISLSNNHTLNGKPFVDICDFLKGTYPKDFKFTGWHPMCRCWAIPVTPTQEEVIDYTRKLMAGEDVSNYKFKGEVKELPKVFTNWMKQNSARVAKMKNKPYFIADNEAIIYKLTPLQIAEKRHAERTPEQIADIQAKWDARRKENELILQSGKKILNVAYDYGEVDYSKLEEYITKNNYVAIKEETKKIEKIISEYSKKEIYLSELIPDAHEWHKQFTISELQKVYNSVKKKLSKLESLSLEEQLEKLKYEAYDYLGGNTNGVQSKNPTWPVLQKAYIKQLNTVEEEIFWKEAVNKLIQANKFDTNSNKYYSLIADLDTAIDEKDKAETEKILLELNKMRKQLDKPIKTTVKDAGKPKASMFDKDSYSQERKNNAFWTSNTNQADEYYSTYAEENWKTWSKEEKHVAYLYTSGSNYINEPLFSQYHRKVVSHIDNSERDSWEDINTLTSLINNTKPLQRDVWMQRGEDLKAFYGKFKVWLNDTKDLKSLIGKEAVNTPFTSCGVKEGGGFLNRDVILKIYAPKGTKGIYTEPYSHYGDSYYEEDGLNWNGKNRQDEGYYPGQEIEFVLQRGTKFRITDVRKSGNQYFVDVEIIEQPAKYDNQI